MKVKLTTLCYTIQSRFRFGMMGTCEGILIRPRSVLYVELSQWRKSRYRTQPDVGNWRSDGSSDDETAQNRL